MSPKRNQPSYPHAWVDWMIPALGLGAVLIAVPIVLTIWNGMGG